jgi:hypothetical protein
MEVTNYSVSSVSAQLYVICFEMRNYNNIGLKNMRIYAMPQRRRKQIVENYKIALFYAYFSPTGVTTNVNTK